MGPFILGVILPPLFGAAINGLLLCRAPKIFAHIVGTVSVAIAFLFSLFIFRTLGQGDGTPILVEIMPWLEAGALKLPLKFIIDPLSSMMLLVITGIGTCIHIYAGGYMAEEEKTYRFFAYLNLFVFMMLILVLGESLPLMFVGWEGVGLCSYLLIGYWFTDDANAAAGMKAFLVNRIGDIGFLFGIFLTYKHFGTLSFTELKNILLTLNADHSHWVVLSLITFCLFVGATGKSAQLPLYVWLPDAMAGPTPVSALIHAATMVTAGIYMMTRLNFMFYMAPLTMNIIACVGVATAFFAATIALVQTDIKKVLAYSTVSQLGYMVLACGIGAFDAAVFHLLTHACFKALLFLGAGSVIVAMHHKQDMMEMGGLRRHLPITHAVILVGVLAIIGFPGLAGFFSKDEILWQTYQHGGWLLWGLGAATAGLTSFYMVRLLCLTFYGECRADHHTQEHLHETSPVLWAPLVVLAILSIVVGYLWIPHVFGAHPIFPEFLKSVIAVPDVVALFWNHGDTHEGDVAVKHSKELMEMTLMGISVGMMAISSLLALKFYKNGPSPKTTSLAERFSFAYNTLKNKYWVDEFYNEAFVIPLKDLSHFLWSFVDVKIIDGLVNGVGQACILVSGVTSFRMTGNVQRHAMIAALGVVCLLLVLCL